MLISTHPNIKWRLTIDLKSFHIALSSSGHCCANSSCFDTPGLWARIISSPVKLSFGILSPYLCLEAFQALSQRNFQGSGACLHCFLSCRGDWLFLFGFFFFWLLLLPHFQRLKAIVFIWSGFALVSSRRVNLVLVMLSWLEVKNCTSERNKWLYYLTHYYLRFSVICSQIES